MLQLRRPIGLMLILVLAGCQATGSSNPTEARVQSDNFAMLEYLMDDS